MEIVNNTALKFRVRNPDKFKIIPKHTATAVPGGFEVMVYWGLDEVRVLKNMGFKNVPSPIERKYNWPGRYKPMAHQRTTSGFLTMHRRAFVFNDPGCVDADTEYLSPTGWRRIGDYTDGRVGQYVPETGSMEFVAPEEFVKLPCAEMVFLKTKYGLDQMLSPEHRMLINSNCAEKQVVMQAADVLAAHDDWHAGVRRPNARRARSETIGFAHMAIPTVFNGAGGEGMQLTDAQLRVQVAVVADAHMPGKTTRVTVRLKKARKVERMRALLTAAGIAYKERAQNTATAQGFHIFTFAAPIHAKEFDARFWACSAAQLAVVADEVLYWDGCVRGENKGSTFTSTSKLSADFVQYAWNMHGVTARVTVAHSVKYTSGVCYTVTARGQLRMSGLITLKNNKTATMGVVPTLDGFKYCFRVPSTFLVLRRNGCVFASGNTGKTLSTLWAADYLMARKEIRRVLVICPLSIMHSAWLGDITSSVIHRSAIVAHHAQATRRIEMIQADYEFVIINYDGLSLVADEIVNDGRFDLVIADEANCYSVPTTKRWKALAKILRPDTYLWMMTGTPAAQSPVNAYGLAKLVNPSAVPNYMTAWRDKVMNKITMFKWAPKPGARDMVFAALQPAIRFNKADCLDLPPVVKMTREVPMTAMQAKFYKKIKDDMLVVAAGRTISAVNKAVVVSKLLQISAGGVYDEDGDVVDFDATPRMNVLLEVLEETSRKVIIFAMFRSSIEAIHAFLVKSGIDTASIHGGVSAGKRGEIINAFQHSEAPRVLVMQPQATAHGITLTAADTVIFFGPLMSVELYTQAIARADRKGQNSDKVTVVHIQSSPIEKKMFAAMEAKVSEHALLTQMFDEELEIKQ